MLISLGRGGLDRARQEDCQARFSKRQPYTARVLCEAHADGCHTSHPVLHIVPGMGRAMTLPHDDNHVAQIFLSSLKLVVSGALKITNKDAKLLCALALQATRGDFEPKVHSAQYLSSNGLLLIPEANLSDNSQPAGLEPKYESQSSCIFIFK